jgi:hypothetical protein
MTFELRIQNAKLFLGGQLALYKIEFVKEGNNKYLKVMDELNDTIEVLNTLDEHCIKLKRKQ